MKFTKTPLKDCFLIEYTPKADSRGLFTRTFCVNELKQHSIDFSVAQCNSSVNPKKGTLRGLHFQIGDGQEAKIVSCFSGSIFDVVVDLRPDSPTFKQWVSFELSAEEKNALYIPKGCAHGFQTLKDNTEVLYWMSEFYDETLARGIRWNDPAFRVQWPQNQSLIISDKDQQYPDYL